MEKLNNNILTNFLVSLKDTFEAELLEEEFQFWFVILSMYEQKNLEYLAELDIAYTKYYKYYYSVLEVIRASWEYFTREIVISFSSPEDLWFLWLCAIAHRSLLSKAQNAQFKKKAVYDFCRTRYIKNEFHFKMEKRLSKGYTQVSPIPLLAKAEDTKDLFLTWAKNSEVESIKQCYKKHEIAAHEYLEHIQSMTTATKRKNKK